MIRDGHFGDHTGCTNTRFSRRVLAPIALGRLDHAAGSFLETIP
jgi:hypothetical protein